MTVLVLGNGSWVELLTADTLNPKVTTTHDCLLDVFETVQLACLLAGQNLRWVFTKPRNFNAPLPPAPPTWHDSNPEPRFEMSPCGTFSPPMPNQLQTKPNTIAARPIKPHPFLTIHKLIVWITLTKHWITLIWFSLCFLRVLSTCILLVLSSTFDLWCS